MNLWSEKGGREVGRGEGGERRVGRRDTTRVNKSDLVGMRMGRSELHACACVRTDDAFLKGRAVGLPDW